jgi:uncharacterized protein
MTQSPSPAEVFGRLVHAVAERRWEDAVNLYAERTEVVHPFHPLRAPALRSRAELREHFRPADMPLPDIRRRPAKIKIHETTDPEVIVAEFEYQGTVLDTGEEFSLPCIFVLRVRQGQIVASRDYLDHFRAARVWGVLDEFIEAAKSASAP